MIIRLVAKFKDVDGTSSMKKTMSQEEAQYNKKDYESIHDSGGQKSTFFFFVVVNLSFMWVHSKYIYL